MRKAILFLLLSVACFAATAHAGELLVNGADKPSMSKGYERYEAPFGPVDNDNVKMSAAPEAASIVLMLTALAGGLPLGRRLQKAGYRVKKAHRDAQKLPCARSQR